MAASFAALNSASSSTPNLCSSASSASSPASPDPDAAADGGASRAAWSSSVAGLLPISEADCAEEWSGGSAAMTGCYVSICGAVGFVGLVVPHVARLLVGADHRRHR